MISDVDLKIISPTEYDPVPDLANIVALDGVVLFVVVTVFELGVPHTNWPGSLFVNPVG